MSTTGAHVRNRHQVGPDGLAATRDTHGPPGFSPAVQGVSYADQRSGEQSQLGDLAPGSVDGSIIGPGAVDGGVHILPATLSMDLFAEGIIPPRVVDELPVLPDTDYPQGSMVLLTTDGKLYRTPTGTAWTAEVDGNDILAGSIVAGKVAAGAIGTTELAAGSITTEKFHVGAKAPNVENATSEVLIDSTGITILNGKITLMDYAGQTALSAAGFGGAWVDFVATGVYNAQFNAGPLSSGLTAVGSGATYEDKRSEDIPFWVMSDVSGAGASYGLVDDPTWGREFRATFLGGFGPQQIEMYQDVPAAAQTYYAPIVWVDFDIAATVLPSTYGLTIKLYTQSYDENHAPLGGELYSGEDGISSVTTQLGRIYGEPFITAAHAKYVRFRFVFEFDDAGDGTDVVASLNLLQVRQQQLGSNPILWAGHWNVLGTRGLHKMQDVSHTGLLAFTTGDGLSIRSSMASATGNRTFEVKDIDTGAANLAVFSSGKVSIEAPAPNRPRFEMYYDPHGFAGVEILGADASNPGQIALGPGSGAVDVHLSRGAANRLDLASGDSLRIVNGNLEMGTTGRFRGFGTAFPSSPASGDLFFRTDLGEMCVHDGTRWLGEIQTSTWNGVGGATVNGNSGYLTYLTRDIKLVRAKVNTLTLTTNNGSNYWTIRLRKTDRSASLSTTYGSQVCSGFGTSSWNSFEMTMSDVVTTSSTLGMLFDHFKTGSPGALHYYGEVMYRTVYT